MLHFVNLNVSNIWKGKKRKKKNLIVLSISSQYSCVSAWGDLLLSLLIIVFLSSVCVCVRFLTLCSIFVVVQTK